MKRVRAQTITTALNIRKNYSTKRNRFRVGAKRMAAQEDKWKKEEKKLHTQAQNAGWNREKFSRHGYPAGIKPGKDFLAILGNTGFYDIKIIS